MTPTQGKAGYELVHNNPNLHAVDLAGVGDTAFEMPRPSTDGIYFTKGDALVVIVVLNTASNTPPHDQAIALAKAATDRV